MSDKRTIQINPELFKIPTKEKKVKARQPIKMKNAPKKNKTIRNQIMKMIRSKQQEKYTHLFDEDKDRTALKAEIAPADEFKKDFKESIDYLSNLAKRESEKVPKNYNNHTLRNFSHSTPSFTTVLPLLNTSENVSLDLPNVFDIVNPPSVSTSTIALNKNSPTPPSPSFTPTLQTGFPLGLPKIKSNPLLPPPPYGVLKVGGTKPTYRTWHNQTLKNTGGGEIKGNPNSLDNLRRASELKQKMAIQKREQEEKEKKNQKKKQKLRQLKQKKIYKRTYRVGRSKTQPKIGVLISNKTIRSNISTKTQLLKQEPIQDIKKFLIKKGLIKVGTPTPNDILRKMYESVVLICGEVQNHNPENLLYNFIHDAK
jgi:hypothetical protein